jgi:hypothetical protein
MESTKAKHGRHPKSIWTTAASWFSNTPKDPDRLAENRRQKKTAKRNLAKVAWRATLATNERVREFSHFRQTPASSGAFFLSTFQFSAFQHFSFTQIPLFPRPSLLPASGPATSSFNGLHPKSKFLAV